MKRRAVLATICGFGAAGGAGCLAGDDGSSPGDGDSDPGTKGSTTTTPNGSREGRTSTLTVPPGSESDRWRGVEYGGDHEPPSPPSNLSADVVRDIAAEAEEAHLYDRLESASGLEDYGVAGYTVQPGAYVADRGPNAVLVRVRLGYSYECGSTVADLVSTATYRITTEEVVRVDGTTVDPACD